MSSAYVAVNNGYSTLAAGITTSSQTTITLAAGEGARFPSPTGGNYTLVTVENAARVVEIVSVVGRSTDTLTVGIAGSAAANSAGRGMEGTTATTWLTGDVVECRATAAIITIGANASALAGSAAQAFSMTTATQGTNTTQGASTAFVINEFGKHKNLIIGGDFTTNPWQRGTTFTALGNGSYGADRTNGRCVSDRKWISLGGCGRWEGAGGVGYLRGYLRGHLERSQTATVWLFSWMMPPRRWRVCSMKPTSRRVESESLWPMPTKARFWSKWLR